MDLWEFRRVNPATGLGDVVLGDIATWQISPIISDAGTVQFTYPRNGANWSAISTDDDIAVYYKGVELGGLRSTFEQVSYDDANLNEEGDIGTCTGRLCMARMERAVVYPSGWPGSTNPPNVTFSGASAGGVLINLLQAAQLRGTVPEIDFSSFSDTLDSAGNAWTSTISISWNAQTTYLQIVNDLQSYGLADCVMVAEGTGTGTVYHLKAYNYQALGVDRTLQTPPVIVHRGRDLTQSNFQGSTRTLQTVALMSGSNNLYVEYADSGAVSAKGRREGGSSASGVTDPTQLTQLGQQFIGSVKDPIVARTNQFSLGNPNTPIPGDSFDLGDWLWTDIVGTLHRQRVIQWSLQSDADGIVSGTAAMDTIFGEFLTRLQARVNAIESGAVITGASDPNPVVTNLYPPSIPTGLAVGTSVYLDNQGHTLATLNVSWNPVTTNQNLGPLTDLQAYLVQIKQTGQTQWASYSISSSVTTLFVGALPPNVSFGVQVGCTDSQGNFSGWSSTVTATTASDVTPPNQPSTPTVASKLGQLTVTWDGKDSSGNPMPGDFDHLIVYVSSSSSTFTPSASNAVGTMRSGGTLTISGTTLTYGLTYFVRTVAFDQTGNPSTASTAGSAVLSQVVTTDITDGQVSLSNLAFSDVGNLINSGAFEDANWRATYNALFGGSHFGFDNTTSSAGTWSVIHTGSAGQTGESVVLSTINAKAGQTFMGAADVKMDSSTTSAMFVSVGVKFLSSSGALIGSEQDFLTNWTSPSTNDNTWRLRISASAVTAPAGTVQAQFVLTSTSHTAGHVWLDNVEVRMQVDTLLVANAAITDAKIGTVSANKIIAGTLSAGVIISGSIGTSATGQRCVMDGTGFHGYDSSGNLVFDVNNFNDVITLSQGTTGPKVTIDTIGVFPTIRLYDAPGINNAFINAFNNDGNSAGIGIDSGSYTVSTTTYRNVLSMQGSVFGIRLQVTNDSTALTDGGIVQLLYDQALIGLFITGRSHGGQLIFSDDATNSDSVWELDGHLWAGATPAVAQGVFCFNFSGFGSGVGFVNISYGTTMYSGVTPFYQVSCVTTSTIPAWTVTATSPSNSEIAMSAGMPSTFSLFILGIREW